MNIIKFTVFLFILTISGCGETRTSSDASSSHITNKFTQTFKKPTWFDSIDAPVVSTEDEVSALWQSKERCCGDSQIVLKNNRVFFKSCFNAVSNHFENERLVVLCLWLMDVGAEADAIEYSRFLVDNYFDHKNRVDNCANCMPGDTVARVTLELANYESRQRNSKDVPIKRIENLLDAREDEISYWVQAEIYEFLGDMYLESDATPEELDRYKRAFDRLNKIKDHNEPLARRFPNVEEKYNLLFSRSTSSTGRW